EKALVVGEPEGPQASLHRAGQRRKERASRNQQVRALEARSAQAAEKAGNAKIRPMVEAKTAAQQRLVLMRQQREGREQGNIRLSARPGPERELAPAPAAGSQMQR